MIADRWDDPRSDRPRKYFSSTMIYDLGPRAHRIYLVLRQKILSGELGNAAKLPSHRSLAAEFGVAPMTIRHVLAYLEHEGLVSRELGRGTFVRALDLPLVLIVGSDPVEPAVLADQIDRLGYQVAVASSPSEALAVLSGELTVGFVLTGIRLPSIADGMSFIRLVRHHWPDVPVGVLGATSDEMHDIQQMPESPVIFIARPFRSSHVEEALRLALPNPSAAADRNAPLARRVLRTARREIGG
jgi:CheY-like chemotaxis protein